jgi:hypothetical protein
MFYSLLQGVRFMSCVISDLTGLRFGKLLVVEDCGRDQWGQVLWLCQCDCGNKRTITGGNLRRPNGNISCGCGKTERLQSTFTTHGKSKTKEYRKQQDFDKRFRKYGITYTEFKELEIKQEYRCAICGVVPTRASNRLHDGFHIDHCHVSGRVRGLLCSNCNTGIGMLKDSETILQSAIKYLHQAK